VLKLLQGHITISTTGQEGLAKTIHEITLEHGDSTFPQVGFLWSQTIKGINQKMEDIGDHVSQSIKLIYTGADSYFCSICIYSRLLNIAVQSNESKI